ncbi:hypothetical protein ACFQ0Q_12360 [Streptomyces aureus]
MVALDEQGADIADVTLDQYDAALMDSPTGTAALHARGRTAVVTFP